MMFNNLYKLRVKHMWPMAVISGVLCFLAGPFMTMMRMHSLKRINLSEFTYYTNAAQSLNFTMQAYLFITLILAVAFGIAAFAYLHQKRQIDFYHSQPVTRKKLFWASYTAVMTLLYVPMVVMLLVNLIVIAVMGYGSVISSVAVGGNLFHIVLFSLAMFSVVVFAAQLTGNTGTHGAMSLLLSGIVPLTYGIYMLAADLFRATSRYSMDILFEETLKFSTIGGWFIYLFGDNGHGAILNKANHITMIFHGYSISLIAGQLVIILLMTAGAFVLYGRRKSEVCGQSLVYPLTEPILKAYVMFCVGFLGACIVFAVCNNNKLFFYVSFVLFAILAHMTCEVILRKDFKAMLGRRKQCGVLLILLLAILLLMRFDVTGFDRYVPKASDVADIHIVANENWYAYGNYEDIDHTEGITDPETIALAVDLVREVVDGKHYRMSDFDRNLNSGGYRVGTYTNVKVVYHLKNGKTVIRGYDDVHYEEVKDAFNAMFDSKAYNAYVYRKVYNVDPKKIESVYVDSVGKNRGAMNIYAMGPELVDTEVMKPEAAKEYYDYDSVATAEDYTVNAGLCRQILAAYQQDLRNRTAEKLFGHNRNYDAQYQLNIDLVPDKSEMASPYSRDLYNLPVYNCDENTMALLENLNW